MTTRTPSALPGPHAETASPPARSATLVTPLDSTGTVTENLVQLEAGLARIVGSAGARALVQRSRQLCGTERAANAALVHTLLQLASALLGESLAGRLRQLGDHDSQNMPQMAPHTAPHTAPYSASSDAHSTLTRPH